jgi:hypothetical protein
LNFCSSDSIVSEGSPDIFVYPVLSLAVC